MRLAPREASRTDQLGFKVPRARGNELRAICEKRGINMAEALSDALADWLEKYGDKEIT